MGNTRPGVQAARGETKPFERIERDSLRNVAAVESGETWVSGGGLKSWRESGRAPPVARQPLTLLLGGFYARYAVESACSLSIISNAGHASICDTL